MSVKEKTAKKIVYVSLMIISALAIWMIYIAKIDPLSSWYYTRDTIIAVFVGIIIFLSAAIVMLFVEIDQANRDKIIEFQLLLKDSEIERQQRVIKELEEQLRKHKLNIK